MFGASERNANPPQNGEGDRPKGGGGGSPHHAAPRQDARPHHHAPHGPPPRAGEDLGRADVTKAV